MEGGLKGLLDQFGVSTCNILICHGINPLFHGLNPLLVDNTSLSKFTSLCIGDGISTEFPVVHKDDKQEERMKNLEDKLDKIAEALEKLSERSPKTSGRRKKTEQNSDQ